MPPKVRVRLLLLLVFVAVGLPLLVYLLASFSYTLTQLDAVEAERDRWQRPAEVLDALDVKPGNRVVDLGSGAGYFALKIAALSGGTAQVAAVDLRPMSLCFLRVRAWLRGMHNLDVVMATARDPSLGNGSADAVLVANTYHEFDDPQFILAHIYLALRPGGRLVIVDRGPGKEESVARGHEVAVSAVGEVVSRNGFEVVRCEHSFIEPAGDDPWWLLVARRPL